MLKASRPAPRARRLRAIGLWTLKGLLAVVFLAAAAAKLIGHPMMVSEFGMIGLGQGFRIFTGVVEAVAALMLLWPPSAFLGALVLLAVCAGAFVAQVGVLHGDLVHVVALALLVVPVAWGARPASARLPERRF